MNTAILLLSLLAMASEAPLPPGSSHVGIRRRIDQIVLPGTELEVVKIDPRRDPLLVSIENVYPHGDVFRYDLVYQGLAPGRYDLTRWLRRKDGSEVTGLPPIEVEVVGLLAPGVKEPHTLPAAPVIALGGYERLILFGVMAWIAGVLAIMLVGHRRSRHGGPELKPPATLEERLKRGATAVLSGKATPAEVAELERMVHAYWKKRLGLEEARPEEAAALLRSHPEAGPLIEQLELQLHRDQNNSLSLSSELASLLKPYQSLAPMETVEGAATAITAEDVGGEPIAHPAPAGDRAT